MATGLGFLLGAYALTYSLTLFTAATVAGFYAVFGAVYLGIAVLCTWGGVRALTSRGGLMLTIGSALIACLGALGLVLALFSGVFSLWTALLVLVGVTIVVLLGRPSSRAFLARHSTH
ncbi:hypothetical protein LY71_115123 [Geodermatophilus tzadiensis]|uniref:Uncharacterized protein n=1 Tax=Geodermatophilus tzadiensis TaxID=1137988 RepID=A0A2T0TJD4_9ACTN|nr:hypothetical protein [Geodermatophilus tzadiensis]PRY45725.1 hypothetical protein LY71_115123 [Geodermatophilus tzadiensis]